MAEKTWPHVVIVGGGFGGLAAARALRHAPVRVTVIDRSNHGSLVISGVLNYLICKANKA